MFFLWLEKMYIYSIGTTELLIIYNFSLVRKKIAYIVRIKVQNIFTHKFAFPRSHNYKIGRQKMIYS